MIWRIVALLLLISPCAMASSTRTIQADSIVSPSSLTKTFTFNFAGQTASTVLTLAPTSTTSQTLSIPNITGADTLTTLGLAQTFSAAKTFSSAPTFSTLTTSGVLLNNASGLVSSSAGPLAIANGGSGTSSTTQWGVVYGASSTALATTAAGTSGQFLKSNGSAAPTWSAVSVTNQQDVFVTANGSTTAFTLSFTPTANASVLTYLNGVAQTQTTDYSLSGTTLTFVTAPQPGQEILVYYSR